VYSGHLYKGPGVTFRPLALDAKRSIGKNTSLGRNPRNLVGPGCSINNRNVVVRPDDHTKDVLIRGYIQRPHCVTHQRSPVTIVINEVAG
jgi:hypothetical protein